MSIQISLFNGKRGPARRPEGRLRHPLCDLGEDVGLAQHEQVLTGVRVFDLGAAVLAVEDLVALCDIERNALAGIVELAIAYGEDLALLRLLLGRIGQDETA